MRSLRLYLPQACGIRVNVICPWMTDTIMVSGFAAAWKAEGLPVNTAEDVGRVALGVTCQDVMNGKSLWVEGGRAWKWKTRLIFSSRNGWGNRRRRVLRGGRPFLERYLATGYRGTASAKAS